MTQDGDTVIKLRHPKGARADGRPALHANPAARHKNPRREITGGGKGSVGTPRRDGPPAFSQVEGYGPRAIHWNGFTSRIFVQEQTDSRTAL